MSAPTLVFIRAHYVNGRISHYPGEEVPPGLLSQETIDHALDEGALKEFDAEVRPSLYRLFHRFTGASPEQPLTRDQIAAYTLQ